MDVPSGLRSWDAQGGPAASVRAGVDIRSQFASALQQREVRVIALSARATSEEERGAPVALLGGGVTSLYAAWLLRSVGLEVTVFEGNAERVGGRLWTVVPPGCSLEEAEYADMGAMRVPRIPSMNRVFHLFERLGVDLWPYILSDQHNKLRFNGLVQPNTAEGKKRIDETFTSVPADYLQQGSGVLLDAVFKPWVDKLTNDFNAAFVELMTLVSYSTRELMRERHHYPDSVIDWLETLDTATGLFDRAFVEMVLDYFDFAGADWACVRGGMSQVVDKLVDTIGPGSICLSHKVVALAPSIGGVCVSFSNGVKSEWKDVISALPLGCLRLVETDRCQFSVQKSCAFRMLAYDLSVKVVLVFRTRWWERFGIRGGQDSTDMVSRTIVFPSHGLGKTGKGVMIASYSWAQDASRVGAMTESERVEMCVGDLQKLYPDAPIQDELIHDSCVSHAWQNDSWTQGAFALYGPDQFSKHYTSAIEPAVDGRLHFAGEALDVHHAWIVGSLNSAYRAVLEVLERRGDIVRVSQLKELWSAPAATGSTESAFKKQRTEKDGATH